MIEYAHLATADGYTLLFDLHYLGILQFKWYVCQYPTCYVA